MTEQHTKSTGTRRLYRFFIFIVLVVVLDFACGKLLQLLYFKQKSGYQFRTSYAIDSTNQPGLVFGSSRANHHYVTDLLRDSLHMAFYNVGRDGQSILYDYAILQATLKRYTPKMIILDYQDEEFLYFPHSYERLSNLLPYARQHPEIGETVQLRSGYEKTKLLSQVYPFNSLLFNIIGGIFSGDQGRVAEKDGFLPLDQPFRAHNVDRNKFLDIRSVDTNKVKTFDAFIRLCKAKNIEIYVVMSPYFEPVHNKYTQPIEDRLEQLQAPHFNYAHFPAVVGNKIFFSDEAHLNRKGAEIFTLDLISKIRAAEKK